MYQVEFQRAAKRDLDSLPKADGDRVTLAIASLRGDPRLNARKVIGSRDLYRIRVGRYRAILQIAEAEKKVIVVRVARRSESTYRGL